MDRVLVEIFTIDSQYENVVGHIRCVVNINEIARILYIFYGGNLDRPLARQLSSEAVNLSNSEILRE